jgi:hypothetical protein
LTQTIKFEDIMIKTPLNRSVLKNKNPKKNSAVRNPKARTDVRTRAVVDKAIELEAVLGPVVAAGLLQTQHVPFNVAERVLLHPEQRRKN